MESFIVYPGGVKKTDVNLPAGESLALDQFRLVIISDQEWDQIPRIVSLDFNLSLDLSTLRSINYPQIRRLSPAAHLVCFRDIDSQGEEKLIRFLLSSSEFLMFGWNGLSIERIMEWARSGILENAFNLAQMLGSRVLRHHQNRLEQFEDQIDSLEEEIMKDPHPAYQNRIMILHRQVISLKKSLNAHQSVFTRLANIVLTDSPGIWQELMQDTQRELENVRQTHELVQHLREAYQAAVDNRSNDIMKWLTLLATILLPINLMTGFFGMNFISMPLIHKTFGIIVFYLAAAAIVMAAFVFFWKKKWLS